MRAVLQRVSSAKVTVSSLVVGEIGRGYLVLLGVSKEDDEKDIKYLVEKIVHLRAFEDENHKMNYSILDLCGEILVVSQFTLYGDTRKGRRPSFDEAARPEVAEMMYLDFVKELKSHKIKVETGKFQATMQVALVNDGPVTLIIDSKRKI